jgi:hypothetical protein
VKENKQAISIRMSASDVRKVKQLAERLGVRDSDVIRFAVKSVLNKLSPLHDPSVRGWSLVPVFLESGSELFHHFELDASRLETIINEDADAESRVAHDDIHLIASSGARQPYVLRWNLDRRPATAARQGADGNGAAWQGNETHEQAPAGDDFDERPAHGAPASVRAYLYRKYLNRGGGLG